MTNTTTKIETDEILDDEHTKGKGIAKALLRDIRTFVERYHVSYQDDQATKEELIAEITEIIDEEDRLQWAGGLAMYAMAQMIHVEYGMIVEYRRVPEIKSSDPRNPAFFRLYCASDTLVRRLTGQSTLDDDHLGVESLAASTASDLDA